MTSPISSPITTHGDFVLQRVYDAAPAEVYAAWASADARARWFVGPDGWGAVERTLDLRVGGAETVRGRVAGSGVETLFSARYHVVEPARRVIYAADVELGGRHQSVSLVTIEFIGDPDGTRLRLTEQVTFVDGSDGRDATLARKRTTAAQLERLAACI